MVESKMGAVAGAYWPSPRFPSPLIKPEVPISGVRLSDWLHCSRRGIAAVPCPRRSASTQSAYMLGEHFSLADAYLFVWTILPLASCPWRRVLNRVCAHALPRARQKFEMIPTWGSGTLRSGTKELGLLSHFAGCCFPCRAAPRGQRAA